MIDPTLRNAPGAASADRVGRLRRALELALALYAWGLVLALVLGALTADALPPVTVFSQLGHVLTLPALVLLPIAWRLGERRSALALGLGAAAALWFWGPWLFASRAARQPDARASLRVLTWNLGDGLADTEQVARVLLDADPDFAALQELRPGQAQALFERLGGDYPFHGRFEDGLFSKGYLSRIEPERVDMVHPDGAPSHLVARLPFDGAPLTVTSLHASAKLAYGGRHWWGHDQLVHLAGQTAQADGILLGDFNTTERSAVYRRIARTGLRDAFGEVGSGPGFTFPVFGRYRGLPVPPIARIDFLWYARGLECLSAEVTAHAGSDHHGVVAVFARP